MLYEDSAMFHLQVKHPLRLHAPEELEQGDPAEGRGKVKEPEGGRLRQV